jgi:hypothetical protein
VPRVPRSGIAPQADAALGSIAQAGVPAQAAGAALTPALGVVEGQLDEAIQRRKRNEYNEGTRQASEILIGLQEDFINRKDSGTFPGEFAQKWDAALNEHLGQIAEDDVRDAVERTARTQGLAAQRSLMLRAAKIEDDRAEAEVIAGVNQDSAAFGMAESTEEQQMALERGLSRIDFAVEENDIDAATAITLKEQFKQQSARAHYRRRILQNPADAIAGLRDSDDAIGQFLTSESREQLVASAEVELRRRETEARAAASAVQNAEYGDFLDRIFMPNHEDGVPTINEVLESSLPGSAKEHMIEMVKDRANGVDFNVPNFPMQNNLWARVNDPLHPDPITSVAQLAPFIGRGLTVGFADQLKADLARDTTEGGSALKKRKAAFLKNARSQITDSNLLLNILDDSGEERFYEFSVLFEDAFNDAIEQGKNPMQLLNPSSPDYMGNMIDAFTPSQGELLRETNRALTPANAEEHEGPRRGRGPNEDPEAFLKDQGLR